MSLTILDPQTAPIVVDLQKGLRGVPTLHPIEGVIDHSGQLIEACRKQNPRLGETGSAQDVVDLLARRSAS